MGDALSNMFSSRNEVVSAKGSFSGSDEEKNPSTQIILHSQHSIKSTNWHIPILFQPCDLYAKVANCSCLFDSIISHSNLNFNNIYHQNIPGLVPKVNFYITHLPPFPIHILFSAPNPVSHNSKFAHTLIIYWVNPVGSVPCAMMGH